MIESSELSAIREELQMLRNLYKKIAEQNIRVEDLLPGDIDSIESDDDLLELDEIQDLLKSKKD